MALSRRLCETYHSRGRPAGSGRFSTGAYGRSSRTGRLAVDWVGDGLRFGFRPECGSGHGHPPVAVRASAGDPGDTLEHCFYFTAGH
ncbi:hypothetical protein SFUMM280S_07851 [Streptomyces fumanus]